MQVLCQTFAGDTLAEKNLKLTENQLDAGAIDSSQNITLIDTVDIVFDDGDIDGPINYHADDSIVYDMKNQKLYLYGNAYMKYTDIELNSDQIEYDWVSGTLTSRGKIGPDGELESPAMFSEKSGEYEADSMQYNFKTKKGRTFDIVSEQDGAYIHSEVVQKNEFDELAEAAEFAGKSFHDVSWDRNSIKAMQESFKSSNKALDRFRSGLSKD